MTALQGLDDVDWTKLSHAYGKAKDVPKLLRGLASASAKERASAIFYLGASICHQGTFYSATAPSIPFLLSLLVTPKVKDKEKILDLLAQIATLDDHRPLLLDGAPASLAASLPASYRRSIALVRGAWKTYADLLEAREPIVRAAASFLLAWLPGSAKEAAPLVRRALAKEKDKGALI